MLIFYMGLEKKASSGNKINVSKVDCIHEEDFKLLKREWSVIGRSKEQAEKKFLEDADRFGATHIFKYVAGRDRERRYQYLGDNAYRATGEVRRKK